MTDTIPYIAGWSAETSTTPRIVRRGAGIGYADETPYDRDSHGVLWVRTAVLPPARRGRPRLGEVHALRQRRCMLDMLCQVCRTPPLSPDGPYLFLVAGGRVREGEVTASPPVYLPCARLSAQACPHLRRGHEAVWVTHAPAWGVAGISYDPRTLTPVPAPGLEQAEYGTAAARWMTAARLLVSLHGVRRADIHATHA